MTNTETLTQPLTIDIVASAVSRTLADDMMTVMVRAGVPVMVRPSAIERGSFDVLTPRI